MLPTPELTTKSQKVTILHKPATHIHCLLESEVPEDARGIKISDNYKGNWGTRLQENPQLYYSL